MIQSADGVRFDVGCDCVLKTGDPCIVNAAKKAQAKIDAQLRAARNEIKRKKDLARINRTKALLESSEVLMHYFKAFPHINGYYAEQGKTYLDYIGYMFMNGGISSRLGLCRKIEERAVAAGIGIPEVEAK